MENIKPLPCPFCGHNPKIGPQEPSTQGNAWGFVECVNNDCPAKPYVEDGECASDDRGSDAYKVMAIKRWNIRSYDV